MDRQTDKLVEIVMQIIFIALEDLLLHHKKYICFHARDSSYFDQLYLNFKWPEYEDQRKNRTNDYRDSSINTYHEAMENLTNNDIYCIRTGSVVNEKLIKTNEKIIDYSLSDYQNDFNDIYINSNCYFFVGSDSGMNVFSDVQNIPFVGLNFTEIRRVFCWVKNGLFIFKKFLDTKKNKLLTNKLNTNHKLLYL